jgi:hypothetical protein
MSNLFQPKRFLVLLAILWGIWLAVIFLLVSEGNELSTRLSLRYPVAAQAVQPSGRGPHSYSVPMGTTFLSHSETTLSPALLYEDGQLLGPGNVMHSEIGSRGKGRFSFWEGNLIFSASDNSDPRTNGRQYLLVLPLKNAVMNWSLVILSTITLAYGFKYSLSLPDNANKRLLLYFSIAMVSVAFIIPRLPWFVDYPLPAIQPDTYSYFDPVRRVFSGQVPFFDFRTPGYPLFLILSLAIFPYLKFTIILQNLLTLSSALFFVWAIYKTYGKLVIAAGITMVAHVAQPFIITSDFSLLSESLYSSSLVFAIALLLLAICKQKARAGLWFSIAAGFTFWIRPSGIYMYGVLLIVILYMVLNSYSLKNILSVALPMPVMLVLLLSYNYFSFGSFTVSTISSWTLYGITSVYWEPDASFPADVNQGIQKFKDEIPASDQYLLDTSWDPIKLQPIFANNAAKAIYLFDGIALPSTPNDRADLMKRIGSHALKRHPEMAIKCFWSTLFVFLDDAASWNISFYGNIPWHAESMYGTGRLAEDEFVAREYASMPNLPTVSIEGTRGEELRVKIEASPLLGIQKRFNNILRRVFDGQIFSIGYFIVLSISMYMTIRSKLRNRNAFVLFIISSILLLAALTTALISTMSDRYPSPTRFIEVFSITFIPLFWMKVPEPSRIGREQDLKISLFHQAGIFLKRRFGPIQSRKL